MWLHRFRTGTYDSEKNGSLQLKRSFGRPVVTVNAYFQTGPYIDTMWRKALRTIPKHATIKRVLLLGYGAGGANHLICKRFPSARITAVEWDPEMVNLAKQLKLHAPNELAELRIGDAAVVITQISGTFDLILFDLYRGSEPSPLIEDPVFLSRIQTLLGPDGYFLANVFKKPAAMETVATFFSWRKRWRYKYNHLGLFRTFGCGGQGDPIPPDFLPYHAVPALVAREVLTHPGQLFLQGEGFAGRRWRSGPLRFEMYYGDTEPTLEYGRGRRIVFWQTLSRMDIPSGWHRPIYMPNFRKTGYAPVQTSGDYWRQWTAHAQRHRKRWLAAPDAEITETDLETFAAAYRHGTVSRMLKGLFVWMLRRKAEAHGKLMHYWLATAPDGKAIAGLVVLDIPEARTSVHLIAFYTKEAKHSSVNYGLIDHWFQDAIQKGWRYLDFDVFRGPTDPRDWEGFSRFKRQFGTRFILYPNALVRIVK
ncbi:MAG: hypothetical protein ABIO72_02165 [Patescibacteria group bacterium]